MKQIKHHFKTKLMSYSHQFPRQKDKPKSEPLTMKQRADFIFMNIEDKMPKLFELIMKSDETNK